MSLMGNEPENEPQGEPVDNEPKSFEVPEFLQGIEGIEELGEEVLGSPSLKSIKDIKTLTKNYVFTKSSVGKDKVIIPNEKSSPEEVADFWSKMGKPESLDKFEIGLPEETKVEKEFYEGFKQFSFDNNIMPNQAENFVKFMEEYESKQGEKFANEAKEFQEQEIAGLKEEWGDAFDGKLNVVNTVLKEFGNEDVLSHMKNTGLVNDTKLARLLASVGEVLYKEKKLDNPAPSMGLTKDQATSRYNEIKKDPAYWDKTAFKYNDLQKEMEKLLPFIHGNS